MNTALILIDIQKDFCANGALAVKDANKILPVAVDAIASFKKNGHQVIATLDWHPASHKSFASNNSGAQAGTLGQLNGLPQIWWPDHCVQHSAGAKLHADLPADSIDFLVYKGENPEVDSYSAFFDNDKQSATTLDACLKAHSITQLVMLGLATDYCVKFSVLDALNLGYQVNVLRNGCRAVNLQAADGAQAFADMQAHGAKLISHLS